MSVFARPRKIFNDVDREQHPQAPSCPVQVADAEYRATVSRLVYAMDQHDYHTSMVEHFQDQEAIETPAKIQGESVLVQAILDATSRTLPSESAFHHSFEPIRTLRSGSKLFMLVKRGDADFPENEDQLVEALQVVVVDLDRIGGVA